MNRSARCYGAYLDGEIVGFCGIIHFPNAKHANLKKVSRLVVLPDYQGIGIGMKLLETVARYYVESGYKVYMTTTMYNLVGAMKRHGWLCFDVHFSAKPRNARPELQKAERVGIKTYSFEYVGDKKVRKNGKK